MDMDREDYKQARRRFETARDKCAATEGGSLFPAFEKARCDYHNAARTLATGEVSAAYPTLGAMTRLTSTATPAEYRDLRALIAQLKGPQDLLNGETVYSFAFLHSDEPLLLQARRDFILESLNNLKSRATIIKAARRDARNQPQAQAATDAVVAARLAYEQSCREYDDAVRARYVAHRNFTRQLPKTSRTDYSELIRCMQEADALYKTKSEQRDRALSHLAMTEVMAEYPGILDQAMFTKDATPVQYRALNATIRRLDGFQELLDGLPIGASVFHPDHSALHRARSHILGDYRATLRSIAAAIKKQRRRAKR